MIDDAGKKRTQGLQAPPRCPDWCVENCGDDRRGAHLGAPVELRTPAGPDGCAPQTMLTAHLAWLHEHEAESHGPGPEVWVYCEGGSAELDLDGFDAHIRDVERHVLRLHTLRIQHAAVLQDDEPAEGAGDTEVHPAHVGWGCPFWCDARAYSLRARDATSHVHTGLARRVSDRLWISLRNSPFARLPEIVLTTSASGREETVLRLGLAGAKQLRKHLGELIAAGEVRASVGLLPADELLSRMGAQLMEDSRLAPSSFGYVLRDVAPGGRVWVAVPGGLSREGREALIRKLLAEVPIGIPGASRNGALPPLLDERPPLKDIQDSAA